MSKAKIVLASLVWLIVLGIGSAFYRLWFAPSVAEKQQRQQQEELDRTRGNSNYRLTLRLGLDAFSGYAILRSDEMKQELRGRGIKLEVVADNADYDARMSALAAGDLQMAAFPIDALLKATAKISKPVPPATIVAIIDESRGADAILAYQEKYPTQAALINPDTRFVAVRESPSETLVRLLLHTYDRSMTSHSIDAVENEQELLARYRSAKPAGAEVFVTWEPIVSAILQNQSMHKVYDTSYQSGVIVDALVVSRDFLSKNESVVVDALSSYFRARYAFSTEDKKIQLVIQDATDSGTNLDSDTARELVKGILWKNTQDNLAHFGLRAASVPLVEDMIDRIQRVLTETGGLTRDPTGGDPTQLFYDQGIRSLQTMGFHPGVTEETVSEDLELRVLTDAEWEQLVPVGTIDLPPLIFAPGRSALTDPSKVKLETLMETLRTFPRYYLMVRGNASSRGDAEVNRILAQQRAEAAVEYLRNLGLGQARLRAVAGEITGQTSVTFVLAEIPY